MNYTTILKTYNQYIDPFDLTLLISHVTKKSREFFIAHPDYTLSFYEYIRLRIAIYKRKSGIPIAYITGHKEFYGLDFDVNKYTLVPRPDTEILVEAVNKELRIKNKEFVLIDVGTGSGCIPIAIGKPAGRQGGYANRLIGKIFATDISAGALRVAKKNAEKHGVDITFYQGNLLTPLFNQKTRKLENQQIIITANLPYLTEQQFIEEPSIQHEPKSALVAEKQGLALYEELLGQIKKYMPNNDLTAFFEIDPAQTISLTTMIRGVFPNAPISIIKDLSGSDRCIQFSFSKS